LYYIAGLPDILPRLCFGGRDVCFEASPAIAPTLSELARVEKRAVLLFVEILEGRLYRELGYSSMLQ